MTNGIMCKGFMKKINRDLGFFEISHIGRLRDHAD